MCRPGDRGSVSLARPKAVKVVLRGPEAKVELLALCSEPLVKHHL